MTSRFSFAKRLKSFSYAFTGLKTLVQTQHNTWVHLCATVSVIALGFYTQISSIEWCLILFAIGFVWVAEALNTAIEFLCDKVTLEQDPLIKKAKDVAAGAVLISAIFSLVIALIIFVPTI